MPLVEVLTLFPAYTQGKHFCLVLEPCGSSLYDFLKQNGFRGFWMQDIQAMARQSFEALSFLHGAMHMTHTDLKPENILLESMAPACACAFPRAATWRPSKASAPTGPYLRPASPSIKLIDFGNATYENEHHSRIINTRQYRGPEIILDLGWNERSDVWSMGCILMELYTGELLFGTKGDLEHLALMEQVLGPLPPSMLSKAPRAARDKFVTTASGGKCRLRWPDRNTSEESERHVNKQRSLSGLTSEREHVSLAEFVGHLLNPDQARRPSAGQSLKHHFFSAEFVD